MSMKKHLRHVLLWIYDKNNQIIGDDAVEEIREVYGHDSIGRMTVFRWLKKFRNGDKNVDDLEDDPRSGRPSKFNEKYLSKFELPSRSWVEMADEEEALYRSEEEQHVLNDSADEQAEKPPEKDQSTAEKGNSAENAKQNGPAVEFMDEISGEFSSQTDSEYEFSFTDMKSPADDLKKYSVELATEDRPKKRNARKSEPSKKLDTVPKFARSIEVKSQALSRKRKIEEKQNPTDGKRSLRSNSTSTSTSVTPQKYLMPNPQNGWQEPKNGWCEDLVVADRRLNEIKKAKEKPIYRRYIDEVPKISRKPTDPKTPNRWVNCSRRSWDKQIRLWKKSLYAYFNMEPSESCAGSVAGSESERESDLDEITSKESTASETSVRSADTTSSLTSDKTPTQTNIQTNSAYLGSPDQVASLIGHFDIGSHGYLTNDDSTLKEESTLKGIPTYAVVAAKNAGNVPKGPTDFSHLQ